MRVLFVSSEMYPLAKTGGLADVSAALPHALVTLGADMRLLLPGYPKAIEAVTNKTLDVEFEDFMGAGPLRLISGRTPDTRLPIWLVDCPSLYQRSGGLYQDDAGQEWSDNARRFAIFSHVAAQLALGKLANWRADIVHANDWHAGLVPLILTRSGHQRPPIVFTMHNVAYQGLFPPDLFPQLGLPDDLFDADGVEFYGKISFLKAGIRFSDRLTTVSPSYAREILTAEYGCGLDGLLRHRAKDLVGILNGVDYRIWDPADDSHIPANFTAQKMGGKHACKAAAQREFGLEADPDAALIVSVSRIATQKMADIVAEALPAIADSGAQCVLLGNGERHLEERVISVAARFPERIAARIGYDERLAHLLMAGADVLLHPARYEPCGLSQLYAMRYGTPPIVRSTGGLRDTVIDTSDVSIARGTATGFTFENVSADDMIGCLQRALALFGQPLIWRKLQRQAMAQSFGWADSAERYLALYRSLVPAASAATSRSVEAEPALEKAAG